MKGRAIVIVAILCWALALVAVLAKWSPGYAVDNPAGHCLEPNGCATELPQATGLHSGWFFEAVDVPKSFVIYNSHWMAVDSAGKPHMAYGGDQLRYATYDGHAWQTQIVDDGVSVGSGAVLALDSHDRPHIAYVDANREKIKYARWIGDRWVVEYVDDTFGWAHFQGIDIAVDGNDVPGVAYLKGYSDIYLARPGGAGWTTQAVVAGSNNWWPSLSFDTLNRPLIAYSERSNGQIVLLSWTGTDWEHQTVFTVANSIYDDVYVPSLVLDNADQAQIAFLYEQGDDSTDQTYLQFAHRVAGEWRVERIAPIASGYGAAIQLDSGGLPHIAAADAYAAFDGHAWHTELISTGSFLTLDLTPADQPCVSYLGEGGISFALREDDEWRSEVVEQRAGRSVSNQSVDVAISSDSVHHVSYFDGTDQLVHASGSMQNWQIAPVAPGVWDGVSGVAIDSQERPVVAFHSRHQGNTLDLARWTVSSWLTETVTAASTDDPITLELDGQDRPHVAFSPKGYAVWNGSSWDMRLLDAGVVQESSMALDDRDRAHFVYLERVPEGFPYQLRHGAWLSDSWDSATIEPSIFASGLKVAVDQENDLHLVYQDGDSGDLMYMRKANGEWISETIATDYARLETDLVVDSSGSPSVLYYFPTSLLAYMHLARRTSDGWDVQVVGRAKVLRAALALDPEEQPVLAYYAVPNGGIYLARRPVLTDRLFLPALRH